MSVEILLSHFSHRNSASDLANMNPLPSSKAVALLCMRLFEVISLFRGFTVCPEAANISKLGRSVNFWQSDYGL